MIFVLLCCFTFYGDSKLICYKKNYIKLFIHKIVKKDKNLFSVKSNKNPITNKTSIK